MKRYVCFAMIGLLFVACAGSKMSREKNWPSINYYYDMAASELNFEINMMKKDLEYFKHFNDPKNRRLAVEVRNRLNVLFHLYSERTGRSLGSVLKMYGY